MPFDTPITLHLEALGTRDNHGEYVPGPITDYPLWADQRGAGSTDTLTSTGTFTTEVRTFTVRWFRELEIHQTDLIRLTDGAGSLWDIESVASSDERRRYITMFVHRRPGVFP